MNSSTFGNYIDGAWSGGAQLFWTPAEGQQTLSLPFDVKEAGKRNLLLMLTNSHDYGIFQVEVDGKPLGVPVDLFNAAIATKDKIFGPIDLAAGPHTLSFRNTGKHADSKGFFFGLDGILLGE